MYKYVPYGPVNEVLPYLSRCLKLCKVVFVLTNNHILPRRAHENKGILEKLEKEKSLLKRELRDRVGILLNVKETMIIRSKQQKDDQQGI